MTIASRFRRLALVFAACLLGTSTSGIAQNAAVGKKVMFAPTPDYRITSKGDTDETDLTDGKITTREDQRIWFDARAVGWNYPGLVRLAVDLEKPTDVKSISIRLLGGSVQSQIGFPPLVRGFVSDDGKTWCLAGQFSHFKDDPYEDRRRFGVPPEEGKAFVHELVFGVNAGGIRYVGFEIYGSGVTVSDELTVQTADRARAHLRALAALPRVPFSVTRPQLYFHKPVLQVPVEVNLPNPVGLVAPAGLEKKPTAAVIELPASVRLVDGRMLGIALADAERTRLDDGGTRYRFVRQPGKPPTTTKTAGRLYLRCDRPGLETTMRYGLQYGDDEVELFEQPMVSVTVPEAPRPEQLESSLTWMSLGQTMAWPGSLDAFRRLGLNALPMMARYTRTDNPEVRQVIKQFRDAGFKIHNIDSPFHYMLSRNRGQKEMYHQLEDGSVGGRMCPAYRGKLYKEEIARVARECVEVDADLLDMDIELWTWRGPVDSQKCTRCRADFKASGHNTWDDWKLAQGTEIMTELVGAIRTAKKQAGQGPITIGVYHFTVQRNYQHVWPVAKLYPDLLDNSQTSVYSALDPYHVALNGNVVRADRKLLPETDTCPWVSPGDAGTFTGKMFYYTLLECFANGTRGMRFWSNRVWDTESLVAYARTMQTVVPVEHVIIGGKLAEDVKVDPAVRVSGMRRGDELFLLLNNLSIKTTDPVKPTTVTLSIPSSRPLTAVSLPEGKTLATGKPAGGTVQLRVRVDEMLPLHVKPTD